MKPRRLQVTKRLQVNLRGSPPEQRAFLAEHVAFHETQVRAGQQHDDVPGVPPMAVPALLQVRQQTRTGSRDPLKLVKRQNELGAGMRRGPVLDDGEQGLSPTNGSQFRKQRHGERASGLFQKRPHLQGGRRLLTQVVNARLVGHEFQDELALADNGVCRRSG